MTQQNAQTFNLTKQGILMTQLIQMMSTVTIIFLLIRMGMVWLIHYVQSVMIHIIKMVVMIVKIVVNVMIDI